MILRAAIVAAALVLPAPGRALTLDFPALAVPLADKVAARDSYFLPLGPYQDGAIEGVTAEGALLQQSWRVGTGTLTTLQLLVPLRDQLEAAGYETVFECVDRRCGGFDFRYRIDVLPEPDMHVNLGDYRYLSARRGSGDGAEHASLVVSRSANAGFVQLTLIGEAGEALAVTAVPEAPEAEPAPATRPAAPEGSLGERLERLGHTTLDDLAFDTGSSELGAAEFASLAELAAYLKARPEARVMLVGHTDAVGALDRNIALSRQRARSVMARLVSEYGVPREQVGADGVGFLSPIASNLSEEGRALNRRVEVVLTSTQ